MKKKGQISGGIILTILIAAVIGVVVLGLIFSLITTQTTRTDVTSDRFTAINRSCVRLTSDCFQAGTLVVRNSSSATSLLTGNFSECGEGSIKYGAYGNIVSCGECLTDSLNASYTEQNCGYIEAGMTRTIVQYLPVMIAIVLFVFVAGFIAFKGRK